MNRSARLLLAGSVVLLVVLPALAACGGGATLPEPRTVIVFSGERLSPDRERLEEVERWLRPQLEDIDRNPSFLIRLNREGSSAYPWDTLEMEGDTVSISVARAATDAETPYLVYAHLHIMAERDELGEWLPEAEEETLVGLEREEAILRRVSDIWLLGRSAFDTQAFGPLDELLYARERGFLRSFVLATQGDRFAEARDRHAQENPEWEEELSDFFVRTFERKAPGYLPEPDAEDDPGV
jgi:hypothetical protein